MEKREALVPLHCLSGFKLVLTAHGLYKLGSWVELLYCNPKVEFEVWVFSCISHFFLVIVIITNAPACVHCPRYSVFS